MSALCPFCKHNNQDLIDAIRREGVGPTVIFVSGLCYECGELVVVDPSGLRRPSDAEYLQFGATAEIRQAREVWVEFKKQDRPPNKVFKAIASTLAQNEAIEDPMFAAAIKVAMLYGARAGAAEVEDILNSSDSYDEFVVYLKVFTRDIEAAISEAIGTGRSTLNGIKYGNRKSK
jgi:hypothetical protein